MDVIKSIKKLDVQSGNILVLSICADARTNQLKPTLQIICDWLSEHDLHDVQVVVAGEGFHIDMIAREDMYAAGWYRKDDL